MRKWHESLLVNDSYPFFLKKEKGLAFGVWEKKVRRTSLGTINHSLASSFFFFLSKHIYIVAPQSGAFFFFPGISKIIWKEIDHTHYAALGKTRSSLPELPCNRLQMKYKSNINRNSWQLEFRKCWRLFCAGDYCSLWESTSRSQRMGFIFLDSILASIHVQWVSLRNVYKWVCDTRRECAIFI